MTKKLEDLFNLEESKPEVVEEIAAIEPPTHQEIDTLEKQIQAVQEITRGLPQIQELNELDDKELDHLATKAEQAYDDLMDLGMNVEARYGSRMFEVAAQMMNAAITAKSNKIDKKLKMVDLQLKKLAIDKKHGTADGNTIEGEGYIITDRNSILEKLKNLNK